MLNQLVNSFHHGQSPCPFMFYCIQLLPDFFCSSIDAGNYLEGHFSQVLPLTAYEVVCYEWKWKWRWYCLFFPRILSKSFLLKHVLIVYCLHHISCCINAIHFPKLNRCFHWVLIYLQTSSIDFTGDTLRKQHLIRYKLLTIPMYFSWV